MLRVKIGSIKYSDLQYGCIECQHLNDDFRTCPAFPDGIPERIITGIEMHRDIKENQIGSTVFNQCDKAEERYEKIVAVKVIEGLIKEYDRATDRSNTTDNIEVLMGYRRGLMFGIKQFCVAYKIKPPSHLPI